MSHGGERIEHAEIEPFCISLPGATADTKWQTRRVFSVAGKMFCIACADPRLSEAVSFKVAAERFLELTDQAAFKPAPYLARHHWVQLTSPTRIDDALLRALILQSYQLVCAKLSSKQRAALLP